MMWTDDPVRDAERHDAECQRKLNKLPKCFLCGEPIQQEEAFHLKTFCIDKWVCDECLENNREETMQDAVQKAQSR